MISSLAAFLVLLKKTKKYVKWHVASNGAIRGDLKTSLRIGSLRVKAYSPEIVDKAAEMGICPVTAVALLKGKLLDQSMVDWAADLLFGNKELAKDIAFAADYKTNSPMRKDLLKVLFGDKQK